MTLEDNRRVAILGSFGEGDKLATMNPPRSALQIAASTRGFSPTVLHMGRLGERWKSLLEANKPILTGISVSTWHEFNRLPDLVAQVKKTTGTTIVVGGIYPSLFPRQTLEIPGVDVLICGYGDCTWEALTESLSNGKQLNSLSDLPGFYLKGEKFPAQITYSVPTPLKEIRQPAYESNVPTLKDYINPGLDTNQLLTQFFSPNVLSQIGCQGDCFFCINSTLQRLGNFGRQMVERRPPQLVVDEVTELLNIFNLEKIPIFLISPDSFSDPQYLLKVLDEINGRGLLERVLIGMDARIDSLYNALISEVGPELLGKLKRRVHKLVLGVETMDAGTQNLIGKMATPDQLIEVLYFASEIRAIPMVQIMVGFPTDSDQTLQESLINLLTVRDQSPPFIINVHRVYPYPGTMLHTEISRSGLFSGEAYSDDLTVGPTSIGTQYLSRDQVENWRIQFLREFYTDAYWQRIGSDPRNPFLSLESHHTAERSLKGKY